MRVRLKRAADAGLGAAMAGAVPAVLCVGVALPGLADPYGSKAQDLLLRWTPGEQAFGWILRVAFAFASVCSGFLALRGWRRGDVVGLVVWAACFVVLVSGWVFGLGFLEAWLLIDRAPGWAR